MNAELDIQERAIAAHNKDAFAEWLSTAEHRLRASLAGFARTVDTEAVIQETLLRIWQVAPRYKPDGRPDGLLRLACRIARNLAITEVRRRRPNAQLPDGWEESLADDHMPPAFEPDDEFRRAILECLERLPAMPRRALEARLNLAGLRDESLAQSLGLKLNTFFQTIRRARLGLLKCLAKRGIHMGIDR